jgi:hypothetical protein
MQHLCDVWLAHWLIYIFLRPNCDQDRNIWFLLWGESNCQPHVIYKWVECCPSCTDNTQRRIMFTAYLWLGAGRAMFMCNITVIMLHLKKLYEVVTWLIQHQQTVFSSTLRCKFCSLIRSVLTDQNCTQEEIKSRLNSGNACCLSVQSPLSSRLLSRNVKVKICKTIILPVVLYGCETWTLTLREEHRLRVFENRVLRRYLSQRGRGMK